MSCLDINKAAEIDRSFHKIYEETYADVLAY